jgi:hypothetical protein
MPMPIMMKRREKSTNGKIEVPEEKADNTKKVAKIIHIIPTIEIPTSPEKINGIRTGLPLHKTFSSARKCLLNCDMKALPKLLKLKPLIRILHQT